MAAPLWGSPVCGPESPSDLALTEAVRASTSQPGHVFVTGLFALVSSKIAFRYDSYNRSPFTDWLDCCDALSRAI